MVEYMSHKGSMEPSSFGMTWKIRALLQYEISTGNPLRLPGKNEVASRRLRRSSKGFARSIDSCLK